MEHICFEAQLCSEILIFKEISNIDILIILCLGTSLDMVFVYALYRVDILIHACAQKGDFEKCSYWLDYMMKQGQSEGFLQTGYFPKHASSI